MTYPVKSVANYFLDLAESMGEAISPMKLQKLIFFAHGWNLALRDEPLVDEQVEAWEFGPVIPSIYREFREFGMTPIERRARESEQAGALDFARVPVTRFPGLESGIGSDDADTSALLDRIWEVYGGYTAIQLSNMSHRTNGAWHKTYHEHGGNRRRNTDIPDGFIKVEFLEKAGRVEQPD